MNQPFNERTNQTASQPINQPTNQPTNRPISQPRFVCKRTCEYISDAGLVIVHRLVWSGTLVQPLFLVTRDTEACLDEALWPVCSTRSTICLPALRTWKMQYGVIPRILNQNCFLLLKAVKDRRNARICRGGPHPLLMIPSRSMPGSRSIPEMHQNGDARTRMMMISEEMSDSGGCGGCYPFFLATGQYRAGMAQ